MLLPDDQLFRTLLDNLHEGVYFTDTDRVIRYWNKAAENITGFSADEVIGRSCRDNILVHVDGNGNSLCKGLCPLAACMRDDKRSTSKVFAHHKEGHRFPVAVTVAPIHDDAGAIVGGLETFYDASSEMASLSEVEELRRRSLLCTLTGIGNRAYCDQVLAEHVARIGDHRFALIVFDIDDFKSVNDRYGHQVGDVVLKMVARTLANAMRPQDFLGRWGGEEFAAILPGVEAKSLEQIAQRLRALVESSSREISRGSLRVTVSIGATASLEKDTGESMFARSDRALYQSKKSGKNTVTVE